MSARLSPGAVAQTAFILDSDRDERASQICMETLLTLSANGYSDTGTFRSPKRGAFPLRSLALSANFLANSEGVSTLGGLTYDQLGDQLSRRVDFSGSDNMRALGQTFKGLIDPQTRRGQKGTWLLYPFHEAMLWHDARIGTNESWDVRKVYMRGSGITLARLLCSPQDGDSQVLAKEALTSLRKSLTSPSQISNIAEYLNLSGPTEPNVSVQRDEIQSWESGSATGLATLGNRLARHTHAIFSQQHSGDTAKLWQFRNVLAIDFALHLLERAWDITNTGSTERFILLSISGATARSENFTRLKSEESYNQCRRRLREAMTTTLQDGMIQLFATDPHLDWSNELENRRNRLERWIHELEGARTPDAFIDIAVGIIEDGSYDRPRDGFRVLAESIGLLHGTGSYRYFTATPDLLESLVGALANRMPMSSRDFFAALYDEFNIVIDPESASKTILQKRLESTESARNARRAERMLIEAGLAQSLSDSTTIVGHRMRQ